MPGRPLQQLLEVISFRRVDGRVSLREFRIAQQVGSGESVHAEEAGSPKWPRPKSSRTGSRRLR